MGGGLGLRVSLGLRAYGSRFTVWGRVLGLRVEMVRLQLKFVKLSGGWGRVGWGGGGGQRGAQGGEGQGAGSGGRRGGRGRGRAGG